MKRKAVTAEELKKACERLNENKKIEKIWRTFKMARRIAKRDGKELSIDIFNKMVKDELGIDWRK